MKSNYEQIMERIEVTDEMRSRVLAKVKNQVDKETDSKKVIPFANWKKYSSIAAVVALVVIGAFAYTHIMSKPDDSNDIVTSIGPQEVDSLSELEKDVGYEVKELENLPFVAEETSYISYNGIDAEIQYRTNTQTIVYSKMKEIDGNNGHYETYEVENVVDVNNISVTLKGNGDGYQLASWDDGSFGYMIYSDVPLDEQAMLGMVE